MIAQNSSELTLDQAIIKVCELKNAMRCGLVVYQEFGEHSPLDLGFQLMSEFPGYYHVQRIPRSTEITVSGDGIAGKVSYFDYQAGGYGLNGELLGTAVASTLQLACLLAWIDWKESLLKVAEGIP